MERKKEIETNNILLANFLEWEESTWTEPTDGFKVGRKYDFELPDGLNLYKEEEIWFEGQRGYADVEQERCFNEDLRFHTDWNWIMLVVDKIEGLKYIVKHGRHWGTCVEDDLENEYFCTITDGFDKEISDCAWTETERVMAVFKACVEFVKWYNEFNLK